MKNQSLQNTPALQGFKKNILALILFLAFCGLSRAQDRITMMNGTEVQARIIAVSDYELKYKSYDNQNGPMYVVPKASVFMINFADGSKVVFGNTGSGINTSLQDPSTADPFIPAKVTKFGGPRFGFTFLTPGTLTKELSNLGKNPVVTQFGWQFEQRLFNVDNGPSGLLEFVPLIGGMEQGLFLPSASLLFGLRGAGKTPLEFAIGPNVSVTGLGMVFAFGTSFHSGNVNFPINIAYVPSVNTKQYNHDTNSNTTVQTGHRITLTIGFNMRKK